MRVRTAQLRIIEQRLLSTRVFHRQYSKRTLAFSVQHNYATQYEKYIIRLITLAVKQSTTKQLSNLAESEYCFSRFERDLTKKGVEAHQLVGVNQATVLDTQFNQHALFVVTFLLQLIHPLLD